MTSSILEQESSKRRTMARAAAALGLRLGGTLAIIAVLFCGLTTTGCGTARPRVVSQKSPTSEPIGGDEAMAHRNWSPSVAYYASGTVQAYPTRWPYEGQETDIQIMNAFVDPVMFLVQTVMLPVRVVMDPPGHRFVNYGGPTVGPTYTASPPLPPEPPLNHPAVEPLPAPEHPVHHEAYRPFGGLRDWWDRTFAPPLPKPRAQLSAPPRRRAAPQVAPTTQPNTEPATQETEPATTPATTPATLPGAVTEPATVPAPAAAPEEQKTPAGQ